MNILIINGPNINMLGIREPEIYGRQDYASLVEYIEGAAGELGVKAVCYQSNHEGDIVTRIQEAYSDGTDAIVINPAAYTHTSIALLDALKAVALPAVEVHLSRVSEREGFRQVSYAGMACLKTYAGYGFEGYKMAMEFLADYLGERPVLI